VLLGGSDATSGELTRLVGQVPPAVQALTGVDLSKVSFFFRCSINPALVVKTARHMKTACLQAIFNNNISVINSLCYQND